MHFAPGPVELLIVGFLCAALLGALITVAVVLVIVSRKK